MQQFDIRSFSGGAALEAYIRLKSFLVNAGWTVPLSGDGGSGGPTGDNIPDAAAFANGTWFVVERPDSGAQFLFIRTNTIVDVAVYYSPAGLFAGGSPTGRAAAVDEIAVYTGTYLVDNNDGVLALMADDAAPYGFYMLGWSTGHVRAIARLVYDPTVGADPDDPDPYMILVGGGSSGPDFAEFAFTSESDLTTNDRCAGTGPGGVGVTVPAVNHRTSAGTVVPGDSPMSFDGQRELGWPLTYARRGSLTNSVYKGVSSLVQWAGTPHQKYGDTVAGGSRILFDMVTFPWNGTVPPQS